MKDKSEGEVLSLIMRATRQLLNAKQTPELHRATKMAFCILQRNAQGLRGHGDELMLYLSFIYFVFRKHGFASTIQYKRAKYRMCHIHVRTQQLKL